MRQLCTGAGGVVETGTIPFGLVPTFNRVPRAGGASSDIAGKLTRWGALRPPVTDECKEEVPANDAKPGLTPAAEEGMPAIDAKPGLTPAAGFAPREAEGYSGGSAPRPMPPPRPTSPPRPSSRPRCSWLRVGAVAAAQALAQALAQATSAAVPSSAPARQEKLFASARTEAWQPRRGGRIAATVHGRRRRG